MEQSSFTRQWSMCDRGGGRNSGSQCPEEETPNSVGMKEGEKMDDMGVCILDGGQGQQICESWLN